MLERSDIDKPMWRKKVDGTLLKDAWTPIPKWLWEVWDIENSFSKVRSKKDVNGLVSISYMNTTFAGQVAKVKTGTDYRYRLYFNISLAAALCDKYLMSYMRVIESELDKSKNHRQVEQEISFWEFIDIEYDSENKSFLFTPYFTIKPQFPNLFAKLINSAPLKAVSAETLEKDAKTIHKQDWKPRDEYKSELGAENVIYMLLDSKKKLLYVGEAKSLKKRFNSGHPDINGWDYYKYNVLPSNLSEYRLSIERMLIRDMASILENKQDIQYIKISDYKLANRKIDR
jgi:hypothetical protein